MSITADFHLHSSYSGDSDTPMEEMILKGIDLGLTSMCFTEHNDFGFPDEPGEAPDRFILSPDPYLYDIIRYREKYADKINKITKTISCMASLSNTYSLLFLLYY